MLYVTSALCFVKSRCCMKLFEKLARSKTFIYLGKKASTVFCFKCNVRVILPKYTPVYLLEFLTYSYITFKMQLYCWITGLLLFVIVFVVNISLF